ncbi:cysteine hydrolase [Rhizobium sophorae]|uniref:Cysteine hydrolase n=1 Tax=Rhizobium sophorae TaxID=1535242 RepID=A0A7Y3WD90_9HYPH|nr:isochorismatase family cysteine hydrolase [Rhizobium sophorae]MBX4864203.1 cysteine hydrolase [Rhizobium bangladeshense]NNU35591.1 cysteine hydrolase [Rhizobium sophorae]
MLFEHKVNMEISGDRTALVLVDIQNDFLTDGGKYFVMIEELMKKNNVNANLETLLKAAKEHGYPVFMSPHYFFPHDHKGKTHLSPMEDLALHGDVVARASPLHTHDLPGSGADIPDRFKPYMEDENTTVVSRHVTYAPTSDLAYMLRRRKIETVVMAGPVANLCLEDHMRNLIRDGFETVMVRDAVAAAANEEGSGLDAAMINWRFMAGAVWTTEETVRRMAEAAKATA